MINQIETTLQDAVERCEKDGGRFWYIKDPDTKWHLGDNGYITDVYTGEPLELQPHDFRYVFVYEPPQKSAFQEWEAGQPRYYKEDYGTSIFRGRKEGWNAAIDAVLDADITFAFPADEVRKLVEKLKEN